MLDTKNDRLFLPLIFFITGLLVFDLFFNVGHSAYMDGRVHITTITQFYQAMRAGDWKPTWADSFANYGLPIPLIAHQLVSYVGAWLTFVTNDVILSWKLIILAGALFSNIGFYYFLRIYFKPLPSFVAVFLFNVAPYRILNLYIREALPEFFASIFLPLILITLYFFIKKRRIWTLPALALLWAGLSLTHPMMLVVSTTIVFPYFVFLLLGEKNKVRLVVIAAITTLWGFLIAAYYLIPLNLEMEYFYYGIRNHFSVGQVLYLHNFIDPRWYYFYENDILHRGNFVTPGLYEVVITIVAGMYIVVRRVLYKVKKFDMLDMAVLLSVVTLFLTTNYASFLYRSINLLSNIQFPWRMLSAYIFLPPIIIAYLLNKLDTQKLKISALILISFFAVMRFPQLYSKNNTDHPMSRYTFTLRNLHSTGMNPIWTGETEDYPVHPEKGAIIDGNGVITQRTLSNSWRKYTVHNDSPIRMADYTFYFPGWKVWVDGNPVEIQFQDPAYRGVITYNVPAGKHEIFLKFTNTKVRTFANIISLVAFGSFLLTIPLLRSKRGSRFLYKIMK